MKLGMATECLAGRVRFAMRPRSASARKLTDSVSAASSIHGHDRYTGRGVQGSSGVATAASVAVMSFAA